MSLPSFSPELTNSEVGDHKKDCIEPKRATSLWNSSPLRYWNDSEDGFESLLDDDLTGYGDWQTSKRDASGG